MITVDFGISDVVDDYEKEIVIFGKKLVVSMLEKYRKGKAEHGGEPRRLDCQNEINEEVLDILNYHLISKVNDRVKNGQEKQG